MRAVFMTILIFLFSNPGSHALEPYSCPLNTKATWAVQNVTTVINTASDGLLFDKASLLSVLREPSLQPTHLFFSGTQTEISQSLDWETLHRNQLRSLIQSATANSHVYIIARADPSGGGIFIAQKRISSITSFLSGGTGLRTDHFHGMWIANNLQPLTLPDAAVLNIPPPAFRYNLDILNDSVHIFVLPCRPMQEDNHPEAAPTPEDLLGQRLSNVQRSFGTARKTLTPYRKNGNIFYKKTSVLRLFEKEQSSVLSTLIGPNLSALRSYAEDELYSLKQELSSAQGASAFQRIRSPGFGTLARASFSPSAASSPLTSAQLVDLVFDKLDALISRLRKASTNLTISVCVISYPAGANFTFHPKKDSANERTVPTNSLIETLWIGRYSYKITKAGFKPVSFENFDFLDESESVIECLLAEDKTDNISLACQIGDRRLLALCAPK